MRSFTLRYSDKMEHKVIYNFPIAAFEELATQSFSTLPNQYVIGNT